MTNKKILILIFVVAFLTLLAGCLTPPNQAPIITSTPITLAEVNELYTYEVEATDPDGDSLTYSLEVKPSGMTISSATGLIMWTPTAKGDYAVVVKVSDGTLDITQSFTIVVSEAEEPGYTPVITSTPITTATVGVVYTYDVDATDLDDDTLTYSLTTYPSGMTISYATGLIMWTPATKGNYAVVVKVSDGVLDISQSFTITVSGLPAVNQAPTIYSIPITTAIVGVTYFYDVNATDPDGDTLTYFLTTKPSGMAINSATGLIMWIPTAEGNYTVVVKVFDGVLDISQSFTIVVSKPTVPLETYTITAFAGPGGSISPLGDVTVDEGKDISFTIIPNANYGIEKVLADGVSVGAVGTYTFTNVARDHTIYATFSAIEPVPDVELTGIEVSPDILDLLKGDSQQLTVTAIYSDVSTLDVTSDCVFQSNDIDIASVNATGIVTANAFGRATITVSYREEITKTTYIEETDAVEVTVIGPVQNITTGGYYDTIQVAINKASDGDTIEVVPGTYNERLIISKSLDLKGAPDNESVITLAGLTVVNPNVLIEIPDGVSNVSVTGFTLIGSATFNNADEAVVRCWTDDITIEDNIINGFYGVIYKGPGQNLIVRNNHFTVNKVGVTCQPDGGSNVMISDNFINLGSSPGVDEQGIYMTGISQSSVKGNTVSGFIHNAALAGSNLTQLTVSGNTFTGNAAGISIWDNSTFITITDNMLSNSVVSSWDDSGCGICIKGADINITHNEIKNNGDIGVKIYRHTIDTERVTIMDNNISDNTNYGVYVDVANVPETVNAENNWWGDASGPYHSTNAYTEGDAVSDNVDFDDWLLSESIY